MIICQLILTLLHSTYFSTADTKTFTICETNSKEAVPYCNVYIFSTQQCKQSDINGKIQIDLMPQEIFQFEFTGFRLQRLTGEELANSDTVYMAPIEPIDLGTTGIQPFMETDRYAQECKCCQN